MLSLITGKLGGRGAPATYTHDGVLRRRVPDPIGQKGYIMKIRRKLISAAVAALVLIGCIMPFGAAVSAAALPYTDVKSTDWFYESVLYAYENGLMNGKSFTPFPNRGKRCFNPFHYYPNWEGHFCALLA